MYDYDNVLTEGSFECDNCQNTEGIMGTFQDCVLEAREMGWIIYKDDNSGEFVHFCCKECSAKFHEGRTANKPSIANNEQQENNSSSETDEPPFEANEEAEKDSSTEDLPKHLTKDELHKKGAFRRYYPGVQIRFDAETKGKHADKLANLTYDYKHEDKERQSFTTQARQHKEAAEKIMAEMEEISIIVRQGFKAVDDDFMCVKDYDKEVVNLYDNETGNYVTTKPFADDDFNSIPFGKEKEEIPEEEIEPVYIAMLSNANNEEVEEADYKILPENTEN